MNESIVIFFCDFFLIIVRCIVVQSYDRSDPPCGGAHDGREPRAASSTMMLLLRLLRVSVGRPPPPEGGSRPGGRDPSKTAAPRHTGDYSNRLPAFLSSSVSLFVSCRQQTAPVHAGRASGDARGVFIRCLCNRRRTRFWENERTTE